VLLSLIHNVIHPIRIVKCSQKIPLGRTYYGKVVLLELDKAPHTKICGLTGFGKTNLILTILYYLCNQFTPEQCQIHIIDLKGASYSAWRNVPHVKRIEVTTEGARDVLEKAVKIMRERLQQIDDDRANFRTPRKHPLLVLLIDEGGELTPADAVGDEKIHREACMVALSTLVRVGREAGIRIIYGTQRPDRYTLPMTIRSQLDNTICFRVRETHDSKIVIGHEGAEQLMVNPGRAVYQSGVTEVEFQAIYIPEDSLNAWLKTFTDNPTREVTPSVGKSMPVLAHDWGE
jgi:S-DNA-T family DNA segregation ATPase FtsK/SpoIIIE